MNFKNITKVIEQDSILLRPIARTDKNFILDLFKDVEVKKYYRVHKEAEQDHRKLVEYWLNDTEKGMGVCWIIINKVAETPFYNREVGFIAFDFRGSARNVRISYAILPECRRRGIGTKSIKLVIETLKKEGVETIEADIDRDNLNSERMIEKLGFNTNRTEALIDPDEIKFDGKIRTRHLWKKHIVEFQKKLIEGRVSLDAEYEQIVPIINSIAEEMNSKGQHPELLVRYFHLLGRAKFIVEDYEEAKQAFIQCNKITMVEGMLDIHENFYWFARIFEARNEMEGAKMYYKFALERYNENPNYMTRREIEEEVNK